jgi:cytochrome c554/c'-like protein
MPSVVRGLLVPLLVAAFLFASRTWPQEDRAILHQMSTEDRLRKEAWWPTKAGFARSAYVGPQACAECHGDIANSQKLHSMARASAPALQSHILLENKNQAFRLGAYSYQLAAKLDGSLHYSVSDGQHVITGPITWAFGAGKVGQSFLSEEKGQIRELRFSFFQTLHTFDITPNQSLSSPASIEKAAGRIVGAEELRRCFGCHSTAANTGDHFAPSSMIPGITCEACHGPGARHVKAMNAGEISGKDLIFNPTSLKPADSVDFCGACHNSWWDVHLSGSVGLPNVRFQAYRLQNSRCWTKADARITCVACHDPHKPLVRDAASYDQRCLSCHTSTRDVQANSEHVATSCPQGKAGCVNCHMPKYKVENMHSEYTDHMIRVVRTSEGFPD